MIIGVTHTLGSDDKFQKYLAWLASSPAMPGTIVLSYLEANGGAFESCDALLLTGGHDVHPSFYTDCRRDQAVKGTDALRDEFEMDLLDRALRRNIPVLGVCRGLQLANVYLGGTLIADLPAAGYPSHALHDGAGLHTVAIEAGSRFGMITGSATADVNSSHHQAVDTVAPALRVVARAGDGIVEAMEWKDALPEKAFFELVQYHPERMTEAASRCAKGLLEAFLGSSQKK